MRRNSFRLPRSPRLYFSGGSGDDQMINNSGEELEAYGHHGSDIITGGSANDYIHGGIGADILAGADGDDEIRGGGENDFVYGGEGNDNLFGGNQDDTMDGEGGDDRVNGERGDDVVSGGDGIDTLLGFTGDDQLNGNDGNDFIYGMQDADEMNGGSGNDRLRGSLGVDEANGGAGNDYIYGDQGNDILNGDGGSDTIIGYDGDDTINGGAGADFLYGQSGNDTIIGGAGDDVLRGGNDSDRLNGGSGNDRLYGEDQNDRLYGEGGEDILSGGAGNDGLVGGDSTSTDTLTGDDGADRFLVQTGDTVVDEVAEDAVLDFVNETSDWTDKELEVIDDGFQELHDRTNNTVLLTDSVDSGDLTYYKYANLGGSAGINYLSYSFQGSNYFDFEREIHIADWDESSSWYNDQYTSVVIHETAHNWDSELELNEYSATLGSDISDFLDLSGWTQTDKSGNSNYTQSGDGSWWYLNSASFSESYGETNPNEDMSTMWEYYFDNQELGSHGDLQGKFDWLDQLFEELSS